MEEIYNILHYHKIIILPKNQLKQFIHKLCDLKNSPSKHIVELYI
jgi:hypothetical protein